MDESLNLTHNALDQARVSRDPRFDGKFFIAVTSTGIYCRPVCPVRSPNKANIRYFPTAAAAAAAGFRPCLRCRPEAAPGTPAWLGTSAVVRRALQLIHDGALDEYSVEQLANKVGIGPRHLHRLFLQHVGAPPIAVAQTRRLHFAKRLLDESDLLMTEIALAAGFGSLRRFNSAFQQTYGKTPTELRKRRRSNDATSADKVVLRLAYRPPYDWDAVRDYLAVRAIPGVERVDAQGYARLITLSSTPQDHVLIRVNPVEGEDTLELHVHGATPTALFQLSSTARRMFDLSADPVSIAAALENDPQLSALLQRRPGLRIAGAWDAFECAVFTLLEQHEGPTAARELLGTIVARGGKRVAHEHDGLSHLFPAPSVLATMDYSDLAVSETQVTAVRALAQAVVDKSLDFSATGEEVVARLSTLPGYSVTMAESVTLRALGEPDAFPIDTDRLRQMLGAGQETPGTSELQSRTETWRPWRGYAAMYLWRAANEA
jgi:AraC family transcriptional regulator, regulatory protein of adaptative response / DNA-3-methyladenine glycosylase II